MFGHELRCPIDAMFVIPQGYTSIPCPIAYVKWVQEALRNAFQLAHTQSGLSANRQKENYDKNLKIRSFEENSFVWRWYPPEANKKLGLGWTGPYKVIKKITDLTYRIQKDTSTKQLVVHVDHLKPYQAAHTPTIQEHIVTPHENVQTLTPPVTSRFGRVIKPRQILTL